MTFGPLLARAEPTPSKRSAQGQLARNCAAGATRIDERMDLLAAAAERSGKRPAGAHQREARCRAYPIMFNKHGRYRLQAAGAALAELPARRRLERAALSRARRRRRQRLAVHEHLSPDFLARGTGYHQTGLDEVAEQPGDGGDVLVTHFLTLAAQTLAHLLPEAGGVDQLHEALAVVGLAVA